MGPIDYSVDVQTPFQAALSGFQAGAGIQQTRLQQQQQAAALEQQQRLQRAYAETATNPTADNFSRLMLLDPKSSEGIQRAWTVKNTQQQQSHAGDLLRWGAAIKSGKPEIAATQMEERADALEAQTGAPTPESKALRVQANVMREHPAFALGQIQAMLAVNPSGKDAAETLAKFGSEQRAADKAPSELARAQAEAAKAGIDAKYAEQGAVLELQKKGWDIRAIQEDIGFKKEANRIAAMNAVAAREGNALKREELGLKIQEARNALDDKIRAKVADTESAATAIDNSLNTIERIKQNKSLNSVIGSLEGRMPAVLDDDASDAIQLIETLGSQVFLSQIPAMKSTGSLSNAEGDKLQSSLQNLSRTQSEKQFRANLDEAARLLNKGRETLSKRTGVPLGKPDTPAAPGARPPLSSFNRGAGGGGGDF